MVEVMKIMVTSFKTYHARNGMGHRLHSVPPTLQQATTDPCLAWAPKNWCFWTVLLEKTLESPLDCKDIQPVHPKGKQSWIFIWRTDVEAETPILWPPDTKSWHYWSDLAAAAASLWFIIPPIIHNEKYYSHSQLFPLSQYLISHCCSWLQLEADLEISIWVQQVCWRDYPRKHQ